MVGKVEKQRMMEFVINRLEDSERYDILEKSESELIIKVKQNIVDKPAPIHVYLHNYKTPIRLFQRTIKQHITNGEYVSNIFYKDGTEFHVRVAEVEALRTEKSLKNYTDQIERMISLRGLEKSVLKIQRNNQLVFFQPKTQRLDEALRGYTLGDVELNYSHIGQGDRGYGFVENRISERYKIPTEEFNLNASGVRFERADSNNILILKPIK